MKNKGYRVSRATLYNTIDLLLECKLVVRHQFGKSMAQYEKAYNTDPHDHLICTECNKVIEFCDPRIQSVRTMVEDLFQFKILHHSLMLYGSCKGECEYKNNLKQKEEEI